MKYEKKIDGSYFHNNLVELREGEAAKYLFYNDGERITAFLNGYAIIPIEKYAALVKGASPGNANLNSVYFSMSDIEEANRQLLGDKERVANATIIASIKT